MTLIQEKRCSRCGEVKPRAQFGLRADVPGGLTYECRACKAKSSRARYVEKNKDKVLLQRRPRRPLPDFAKDSGWKLRRDVERLERIFADDRFSAYEAQVAASVRGHLEYAAQVCQDLLGQINHPTGG